MIPLLYCALADTVIAYVPDDVVFVHEWGVVEFNPVRLEAKGAPWGYFDADGYLVDYYPDEVEAPVIWFHGAQCTGDFIVEVSDGVFNTYLPPPDSVEYRANPANQDGEMHIAVWEDLQLLEPGLVEIEVVEEVEEEQLPRSFADLEDFSWAMPLWREVPANTVIHPSSDYMDSFLYYECSVNNYEMFRGDNFGYTGPALMFFTDEDGLVCSKITVPSVASRGVMLSEDEILTELCHWASNNLKTQEIKALWYTWRPLLMTKCELEGRTMILFPLSGEQIENISRIQFIPDGDIQVRYERLFLGLGSL